MSTELQVNSSFLGQEKYRVELDEVFRIYLEDINPLIVQFEVLRNEFPIELQNEIRAIYGHLARAAIATSEVEVQNNIAKIKSHTKRALLDCYKYSCIIFTDCYSDFFVRYKGIDLSYLENGKFLPEITALYNAAKDRLQAAKSAETSNISEQELFDMYQDAYIIAAKMWRRLTEIEEDATYLKRKATRKDIFSWVSFAVGVVGLIVGIVSILI